MEALAAETLLTFNVAKQNPLPPPPPSPPHLTITTTTISSTSVMTPTSRDQSNQSLSSALPPLPATSTSSITLRSASKPSSSAITSIRKSKSKTLSSKSTATIAQAQSSGTAAMTATTTKNGIVSTSVNPVQNVFSYTNTNDDFQSAAISSSSQSSLASSSAISTDSNKEAADAFNTKNRKKRELWTEDEHTRFLEGLKLHGRDWKKIRDMIGTRSVIQVRSHAQKFFDKAEKIGDGSVIPPRRNGINIKPNPVGNPARRKYNPKFNHLPVTRKKRSKDDEEDEDDEDDDEEFDETIGIGGIGGSYFETSLADLFPPPDFQQGVPTVFVDSSKGLPATAQTFFPAMVAQNGATRPVINPFNINRFFFENSFAIDQAAAAAAASAAFQANVINVANDETIGNHININNLNASGKKSKPKFRPTPNWSFFQKRHESMKRSSLQPRAILPKPAPGKESAPLAKPSQLLPSLSSIVSPPTTIALPIHDQELIASGIHRHHHPQTFILPAETLIDEASGEVLNPTFVIIPDDAHVSEISLDHQHAQGLPAFDAHGLSMLCAEIDEQHVIDIQHKIIAAFDVEKTAALDNEYIAQASVAAAAAAAAATATFSNSIPHIPTFAPPMIVIDQHLDNSSLFSHYTKTKNKFI